MKRRYLAVVAVLLLASSAFAGPDFPDLTADHYVFLIFAIPFFLLTLPFRILGLF